MLGDTLSKDILEHITKGKAASSLTDVYIGLFTVMPSPPNTAGTEVALDGYARLKLGEDGTAEEGLHGDAYFGNAVWDSDHSYYKIYNTEDIQMASISEEETGTATVVGFGLFSAKTGGTLMAYGRIVDATTSQPTTVNLTHGSVPIFYARTNGGDFELRLS